MRKPDFCISENEDAHQLCRNGTANHCLCFGFGEITTPLLSKSKFQDSILTIFCGCTAQFVLDLVRNFEDRFSHDAAHIVSCYEKCMQIAVCIMQSMSRYYNTHLYMRCIVRKSAFYKMQLSKDNGAAS